MEKSLIKINPSTVLSSIVEKYDEKKNTQLTVSVVDPQTICVSDRRGVSTLVNVNQETERVRISDSYEKPVEISDVFDEDENHNYRIYDFSLRKIEEIETDPQFYVDMYEFLETHPDVSEEDALYVISQLIKSGLSQDHVFMVLTAATTDEFDVLKDTDAELIQFAFKMLFSDDDKDNNDDID